MKNKYTLKEDVINDLKKSFNLENAFDVKKHIHIVISELPSGQFSLFYELSEPLKNNQEYKIKVVDKILDLARHYGIQVHTTEGNTAF